MSSAAVQKPPVNTGSSNPRTKDWGPSGEPGSALGGPGRGGARGTGNRGAGRGGRPGRGRGRGGRGGAVTTSDTPAATSAITAPTAQPAATDKAAPLTPRLPRKTDKAAPSPKTNDVPVSAAPSTAKEPNNRPKNSRRSSRSVPTVVVDTTISTATDGSSSTSASARTPNRRRRGASNAQNKPPAPARPRPLDDSLLGPNQKAPIQSGPTTAASVKDTPPHLDMRTDIDALVERVRAVAMAGDRPSTPGSHIDWAGDDDDSLPDLDDWGVKPSLTAVQAAISPIIVEGLRSLPDPVINPPTPEPLDTPHVAPLSSQPPVPSPLNPAQSSTRRNAQPSSVPSQNHSQLHKASPGNRRQPMKGKGKNVSPQVSPAVIATPPTPVESIEAKGPEATSSPSTPIPSGTQSSFLPGRPFQGLEASMHATPSLPESQSAPSNINSFSTPSRFSHNRSHTVERTRYHDNNANRFSRSGSSTPRGGLHAAGNQHNRTHSSPPTAVSPAHKKSHSRPVITGDAMSRLLKTMGSPPSKPAAAPVAKE